MGTEPIGFNLFNRFQLHWKFIDNSPNNEANFLMVTSQFQFWSAKFGILKWRKQQFMHRVSCICSSFSLRAASKPRLIMASALLMQNGWIPGFGQRFQLLMEPKLNQFKPESNYTSGSEPLLPILNQHVVISVFQPSGTAHGSLGP